MHTRYNAQIHLHVCFTREVFIRRAFPQHRLYTPTYVSVFYYSIYHMYAVKYAPICETLPPRELPQEI